MLFKVCHISTVHSVYDDRIFQKECRTLAEEGFEVYYIVTNKSEEIVDGVHIIPLPECKGRMERFFKKKKLAFKKAKEINADIYHFHDPELITIGIKLKLMGKKVIYDSHEDVPIQILNKEWLGNIKIRRIISSVFNLYEKFAARFFDSVISVTSGIVKKFEMNKRPTLVRNLPVLEVIDKAVEKKDENERFTLVYAGGLTRIRGIKELAEAVGLLEGKVELQLMGEWENDLFKSECLDGQGGKYTTYLGIRPLNEVYSYMKAADLGICTLLPAKNHLMSLPVKVFEYMSCSLPVLMSNFPYWVETFGERGIYADPNDPTDIAEKVDELINSDHLISLGEQNRGFIKENYSWESERKVLVDLYYNILRIN